MGIHAKTEVPGSQRQKVCEALTGQQDWKVSENQKRFHKPANGGFIGGIRLKKTPEKRDEDEWLAHKFR